MAAFLFAISVPLAKHLLGNVRPLWLAALLYLGAGSGLAVRARIRHAGDRAEAPLKRSDLPLLAGAIAFGGIIAPVLLLFGLQWTPASSASLLLNFEGVFTGLIAWAVFGENLGRRVAFGMTAIVAAGVLLSWTGSPGLSGVAGPIAIVAACLCWALDNNLTQKISNANPARIAMIKGFAAGSVNAAVAGITRQPTPPAAASTGAIFLGFVSYGLSLVVYIRALRVLGTARAGNYFSTAPFIGAVLGVIFWHEELTGRLIGSCLLMGAGLWLHFTERHAHWHIHGPMTHEHRHVHDEHHQHQHHPADESGEPHSHPHQHDRLEHGHVHYPDTHHRHEH